MDADINLGFIKAFEYQETEIYPIMPKSFAITINSGDDSFFILPIKPTTTNNLRIDWGDGSELEVVDYSPSAGTTYTGISHSFPAENTSYQIKMYGTSITDDSFFDNGGKCGF